jgi:hypothetical protein
MGKFIVFVVIVGALAYAWHQGWISKWFNTAVDSGIDSVRSTQRDATKQRAADPGAPEGKK